ERQMLVLIIASSMFLLLMTRYRIWLYAALAGVLFASLLWGLIEFLARVLPSAWHGLNAFLAMLWLAFVFMGVDSSYHKWLLHKHKNQEDTLPKS
ncbi:MAG TPA: hypothetical protein PKY17_08620, partial [Agitococcus sp.]|nr:hypothetical protein [Agitococcus sp.]